MITWLHDYMYKELLKNINSVQRFGSPFQVLQYWLALSKVNFDPQYTLLGRPPYPHLTSIHTRTSRLSIPAHHVYIRYTSTYQQFHKTLQYKYCCNKLSGLSLTTCVPTLTYINHFFCPTKILRQLWIMATVVIPVSNNLTSRRRRFTICDSQAEKR